MKTVWTAHLETQNEKDQFKTSLLHSRWIFDRQLEILNSLDRGLERQELSPKAYDSPNWQYRQAHANGYRQCLSMIKDLINLDHKEQNDPRQPVSERPTL